MAGEHPRTLLGNLFEGNPARYGVIVGVGAFVLYGLVTLLWAAIGFGSTIVESVIFGAVVGPPASPKAGCIHESRRQANLLKRNGHAQVTLIIGLAMTASATGYPSS